MIYVLVLLLVSGLIAYLGDVLGTHVGKRRLTILGLRPRWTAILVSISTGILITLMTLLTASLLSENVKIALFSVEKLNQERRKLASDVDSLQAEQKKLELNLQSLRDQVRIKEQESVVFRKDAPLVAMVLRQQQSRDNILASLTRFIGMVSQKAREKGLKAKDEKEMLAENQEQLVKMAEHIVQANEDLILAAYAVKNISFGEQLDQVAFRFHPNPRIFKADDEIGSFDVDGSGDRGQIAKTLQTFMEELNHEVVKQGMLGNPLTGQFGDFSSESMISFYDMVNQIKKLNRKITLVSVVKEDTYAVGPLNVTFRLEETDNE